MRGVVFRAVVGAEERALGGDVEGDVALDLNGSDGEDASRDEDGSALVLVTSVNRGLDSGGVEGAAITLGAEVADIVGADAQG